MRSQMAAFEKTRRYYTILALEVFNTILILLLLNVAVFLVWKIKRTYWDRNAVAAKYDTADVNKAYPGLTTEQVNTLLGETWTRPVAYDPFTHFRERPFKGAYVNVAHAGFRVGKDQGPWPINPKNYNVFLFGGSTTFGYGVADDQTLGSHLQGALDETASGTKAYVYNFAQCSYYSPQERILFEKLLMSGATPNMAVFVDGLNDLYECFDDKPRFSDQYEGLIEGGMLYNLTAAVRESPLAKLVGKAVGIVAEKRKKALATSGAKGTEAEQSREKAMMAAAAARYAENKKLLEAICAGSRIQPVFVWQPVPYYKYDLDCHPFKKGEFSTKLRAGRYEAMAGFVRDHPLGDDFLWCADIQDGVKEMLYVDGFHYSAAMNDRLARAITGLMRERGLFPPRK